MSGVVIRWEEKKRDGGCDFRQGREWGDRKDDSRIKVRIRIGRLVTDVDGSGRVMTKLCV